jgi:hypothetical protein
MVMTDTRYTASKTVSTIACIVDCSLLIDQIYCNTAFFCRADFVFTVIKGLLGKVASKAQDVEACIPPHKTGEQQQDIAMNFPMSVSLE